MKNSWTGGEIVREADQGANWPSPFIGVSRGAFERLSDRFERPLFTYAHGILQNAFDAQEVVQDAMMRAHRALTSQYDEERCASLAVRPVVIPGPCAISVVGVVDDGRPGPFVSFEGSELERGRWPCRPPTRR